MQTALAESDAKMEVIKKYEITEEDDSINKADDKDGKTDTAPTLHPPPVPTVPPPPLPTLQPPQRPNLPAPRIKRNAPLATNHVATASPRTEIKDTQGPVLDGLCQAISQQANVT